MLNETLNRIKGHQSNFHHEVDDSGYDINSWLEFSHAEVKKRFHDFVLPYDLNALRIVILAGFFIYILFSIFDCTVNTTLFSEVFVIRLLAVSIGIVSILWITSLSFFKHNYDALQCLTIIILLIGQVGHFVVSLLDNIYGFHLLMSSVLLTISGNTLMGLRFKNALIISLVCLIVFEIIIAYIGMSYEMIVFQNFVLLAVILITLHTCYIRERNKKLLFIQYDKTNISKEKLKKNNHYLETLLGDLDRKNKELQRFSYIISHDLKAPLRVTNGLISLIGRKEFDVLTEQSKTDFDMIKDQSMQMGAMIDGVLEYSCIGRLNVEMEEVDIALVLEKIKLIAERKNQVKINYQIPIPTVRASKKRVEQVFQNLIDNAIKYNDKTICEISIKAEIDGKFILFKLEDNGPGIQPEYAERVFSLFQTLQSKKQDSTGVGLAIVKKIISYYRGEIYIDENYKQGARFCFTLPAYSN